MTELVQRGAEDLARFADERGSIHAAAGVGEGSGYADADRIGAAEQRIVIVARGGVALHQDLAFEGIALHGVAAGIKQIGVAAENLAVPEQNDAAALAGAPIQQGDVDRIEPVLHEVPDAGRRAHGSRSRSYAKARHAPSTRQVDCQFPYRKQARSAPLRRDARMTDRLKLAREMHSSVWHRPAGAGARETGDQLDEFRRPRAAPIRRE